MMKVGQIWRIINWSENGDQRPDHWNHHGEMDKWQGQAAVIKTIEANGIIIVEGANWIWRRSDFEPLADVYDVYMKSIKDPNYLFRNKRK